MLVAKLNVVISWSDASSAFVLSSGKLKLVMSTSNAVVLKLTPPPVGAKRTDLSSKRLLNKKKLFFFNCKIISEGS